MHDNDTSHKRVAFFPSLNAMSGNPYWAILASEIEKIGFNFCYDSPNCYSLGWLIKNRGHINFLHIHFIQQFYASGRPGKLRIFHVIRFLLNTLIARLLGYCLIFTLHDFEPRIKLAPVWADKLAHYLVVRLSNKVIVHCEEARSFLSQKFGYIKDVFIVDHPNYINSYDINISPELARSQLALPSDSVVFTFLGGIYPSKGIEVLIQAFQITQAENFRLVIAGRVSKSSEKFSEYLQEAALTDDRISLHLHYIPDAEIQVFMNAANIVVLPFSKILTSGSTILAMSFGRPVIVPKKGCLPELVGTDAGWLFEPDDPVSLAETMELAANSDYYRVGQNAYKKISSFSREHFARQTIQVYLA